MEKPTRPQDVYIRQRKWVTAGFALIALILLACVLLLPTAVALSPDESWSKEFAAGFLALSCVAAVLFGVPLLAAAVALCAKLPHEHLIRTDEKGLYLASTLIPYGLIPWENIANVEYSGVLNLSQDLFAPDINHVKITLRSKTDFKKGLNFIQKTAFKMSFSRLYVPLVLCKGKGAEVGRVLRTAWEYYSVPDQIDR